MTDIISIRKALDTHLLAATPALPTGFENKAFAPKPGQSHQLAYFKEGPPSAPYLDQKTIFAQGFYQVSVYTPLNVGTAESDNREQTLRNHFPAGLVLKHNGATVRITDPPSVTSMPQDGAWRVSVVSIYWQNIA